MDHTRHRQGSEVLIVGAGPTGMVAALVLAANRIPCRLIEQRPTPTSSSRALGLQARSMELLAGLGLAEPIAEQAYQLSGASIMRGDEELTRMPWLPPDSPYPYTYVLPQQGLETILRRRLDELGLDVAAGSELVTLIQDDRSVTARLSGGRELTASWLIGADGSRSTVREQLGIPFTGVATGETYYLADAVLDPAPPVRDSGMWLGPEGPLMIMRLPGPDGLWRLFVDVTDRTAGDDRPAEPPPELLQALLTERGPTSTRITRTDWVSVYRTRLCLADRYRGGRAFLAGDAAHVFPPFGGQGMNLGIQDAVNLGWRLARVIKGASPDLLDAYEAERRPVAAEIITKVESRRRMYGLRNPLARGARDLLLRATAGSRPLARRTSWENSQLDISYARRRPRPGAVPVEGDRLPDLPVSGGTLHDHLDPAHFTLINFAPVGGPAAGPVEPSEDPVVVRIDDESDPGGGTRAACGMRRGGYLLVRPDGHIAERGQDPSTVSVLTGERG
ncbi:FAD-dependent monooxygenase [Microlunatus parietis]|uniref:4,5-epoxidase n=1 Tax=Microlunatus parietis TaxID=682979 RepID=A0A7Y9LBI7_9ACTN|nr:FAD-dependent monooxygenase [Microlunatus parietis]NYE69871.1 4,5-epoxidase [Microlunatus parietis]